MKGEGEVGPHARKERQRLAVLEERGRGWPPCKEGEAEVGRP